MPATAADIAAATRPSGVALETQELAALLADYPNARDGLGQPARAFWDSPADAAAVLAERFALLSAQRRRFRLTVDGVETGLLPGGTTPTVAFRAPELAADLACLVARLRFDLEAETTELELYG